MAKSFRDALDLEQKGGQRQLNITMFNRKNIKTKRRKRRKMNIKDIVKEYIINTILENEVKKSYV